MTTVLGPVPAWPATCQSSSIDHSARGTSRKPALPRAPCSFVVKCLVHVVRQTAVALSLPRPLAQGRNEVTGSADNAFERRRTGDRTDPPGCDGGDGSAGKNGLLHVILPGVDSQARASRTTLQL